MTISEAFAVPQSAVRSGRLHRVFGGLAALYVLLLVGYLLLRLIVRDQWAWLAFLHTFTVWYFAPLMVLLPLALLLRDRATFLRLLPFAVISLLWYGPYWLPKAASAIEDAATVRVATFNILPLERALDVEIDWLRGSEADIILMQEVTPSASETLRAALNDLYPHNDAALQGTTQLTLSRFPIQQAEEVNIGDWWIRRLVLDMRGREVALYNVHLAMPTNATPQSLEDYNEQGLLPLLLSYDETRRNAQIHRLLALVQAEDLPYIVAGDFNTSDHSIIYGEMAVVMHDAFRAAGTGLGATYPAATGEEGLPDFIPPLIRLDYVWHSAHFGAVEAVTGPEMGSDHVPLWVQLAFSAG